MRETGAVDERVREIAAGHDRSRSTLIPLLQEVQAELGYLPEEAIEAMARYLRLSPSEVFGVITFYAQFRLVPPGAHTVKVCQGTACHVQGSRRILNAVERELSISPGETSADGRYSLERIACFGSCSLAPVMVVDEQVYGRMSEERARELLRQAD